MCTCNGIENPNCLPGCPEGFYYSEQHGDCVLNCPEGYYFSQQLGKCTCDPNENPDCVTTPGCLEGPGHWIDETGRCRCTEDFFMTINGSCSQCGGNQTNSDQEGPCECLGGYEPDPGKIFTVELINSHAGGWSL